jgi:26S proteasome regulatory subunit T2
VKKRQENAGPSRVGRKKKQKGIDSISKLPASTFYIKKVTPSNKCRLRLLKVQRVKDYLLMEQEFIENQQK